MTLRPTGEIVAEAVASGQGAGSFNVIHIEHAEAIATGAEAAGKPVIMQVSENCVRYHGSLEPVGIATLAVARAANVPVAVHLDHATGSDLVTEAVGLGFSSVMFDASTLDYQDNVTATAATASWCRERGVWVEAELGEVGGKDGVHAPGARTDPQEAARYVAATGVDALAVAVGTSHSMRTKDARLDFELMRAIRGAVPVPLVLHGSSGVAENDLRTAVGAGMAKINIATQLNVALTRSLREHLATERHEIDPRTYMGAGRSAISGEVERMLGVLAGGSEADSPDEPDRGWA